MEIFEHMWVNLYDSITEGSKINFEVLHTEPGNFIPHLSYFQKLV